MQNPAKLNITILGLIDYISDVLKNDSNRLEVRDSLLTAIQATFTNKLLENSETSEILKAVITDIPNGANFETTLASMQKSLEGKSINVDLLPDLKESAKEVLTDFVTKAQKPELSEQINILLQ